MGERRRPTLGERGAQPDPIRNIRYGLPESRHLGPLLVEWRRKMGRRSKRCTCGIELPVTGKCDYCD